MKKYFFLSLTITLNVITYSQNVIRSGYSILSPVYTNDTLLITSGQSLNSFNTTPNVKHGYFPLDFSILNTHNSILSTNISIYPNPFINSINLISNVNLSDSHYINIFNLEGQLILNTPLSSKQEILSLSHLKSGIYFVQIYNNTSIITTKKIVKY